MKTMSCYHCKPTGALLAALLLLASLASAHIKNEATQFPDIEFSDARFDIVVLVGAGIVPQTPVFEPDRTLTRRELASWAALAEGLGSGGENPDTDSLANAALEQGLIDSLDGNATFADLNELFFGGRLTLDNAEGLPTKADAATLIAAELGSDSGAALLEKRGLEIGSTGTVAEVSVQEGHHGTAYVMTVGGTALPMDEHGRVANGPTDLLQWEGREIRRSFMHGDGDHASWIYLEALPLDPEPVAAMPTSLAPPPVEELPPPDRSLLYWLAGAALVLGLVLFISRRQSG